MPSAKQPSSGAFVAAQQQPEVAAVPEATAAALTVSSARTGDNYLCFGDAPRVSLSGGGGTWIQAQQQQQQ
jgi:hypothetical protein